jgi:subtilisin family serine protease
VTRAGGFVGLLRYAVAETLDALAIAEAADRPGRPLLGRGDVVLLELQSRAGPEVPGGGPVDLDPEIASAVARLVARGLVVVAAAGNAALDLDVHPDPASGALLVGAAAATPGPGGSRSVRQRHGQRSATGRRVDVHAFGEGVPTLGGGPSTRDAWGRFEAFGGTSAAAAIVAAAVVVLQSARPAGTPPLDTAAMRRLLVTTGGPAAHDPLPQAPRAGGPRPDLVGPWVDVAAALTRLRGDPTTEIG